MCWNLVDMSQTHLIFSYGVGDVGDGVTDETNVYVNPQDDKSLL